ncbi:hypothetical protein MSG28_008707 [Choristoneura fumiferana]|uniref:Uncharacterized protein n=1 Tax=Choristoneura fumiferana TaxID=7141 RepID=A0ACC0J7P0_CHOFU|nr:hypothetical protein MSG28_008707 [Choristoneura fumiferana]
MPHNTGESSTFILLMNYIIMMAQAVLTFSPHNGWSLSLSYHDKKDYHWVMQVIGAILAITGSSIRISLIAMILTCISLVGGVINLYSERTVVTKLLHSGAGTLTLVSAFIGLCLGFDKTIFRLARGLFALITTLLSVLNGILSSLVSKLTCPVNLFIGLKWIHGATGIATLLLSASSLHQGFDKQSFKKWIDDGNFIIALKIFTCGSKDQL